MTSSGGGDNEPRVNRVLRGLAVAMLLVLAGGGCQSGAHSPGSRSGVSATVPAPAASVPAPTGGESYAALCAGAPGCPGGGVPTALRRPIHLPHIAAGARCPVSAPGHRVTRYSTAVIGPGPIYAVSLGPFGHTAILPFVMPSQAGLFGGSAWGGQALKWDGAPSYHGPVLIRGRKLTAHDGLGFGAGIVPQAEMDVPPGSGDPNAGGWRFWPGYARLRSPGCYGLQVDGTTFSEIIIFRACTSSNPVRQTGRCKSR